jgi:hypothetical protein
MPDEPRQVEARVDCSLGEFTLRAEAVVVVYTIKEAISAIREIRSEIVVSSETWPLWFWQIVIPTIIVLYMLLNFRESTDIARRGLSAGYNIQYCQTLDIGKGFHLGNCLKLTKPKAADAPHPKE